MFEATQYLVEREVLSNKKKKSKLIKDADGGMLGSYEPEKLGVVVIKDANGVVQGEVRNLGKFMHLELAVFGPQHSNRGMIKQTKQEFGVSGVFGDATLKSDKFALLNPQGEPIAFLATTKHERHQPFLNFLAPDKGLVANVGPSPMGDFVKIDVKQAGFDPLMVFAFVTWFELFGT
ncbi:MAG: hypothetical protein LUO79_05235 [Methanomassiliicoccales archaeon]|nr:hypothetical protein [Methanomassiliicoccales archaeon]